MSIPLEDVLNEIPADRRERIESEVEQVLTRVRETNKSDDGQTDLA